MSIFDKLNFGGSQRLPVILQTEAAECGLACIAMLSSYHGFETDLPTMRGRFSISTRGVGLQDMIRMGEQLNLDAQAMRLELDELNQLPTPCILHWDMNHFVVLKKVKGTQVEIHDPARGLMVMSLTEVSDHFTGIALTLIPNMAFERKVEKQSIKITQLMGQVRGLKSSLLKIFALALVLEIFALAMPFLNQLVLDQVLVSQDRSLLTILGIGFLILTVTQVLISTLRSWAVIYMSATFNLQWASNVFSHLVRLPVDWFEKRHLGDVTSRFHSVSSIEKLISTQLIEAVLDGLMAIGTLTMILIYSPTLALVAAVALLLYILLRWFHYAHLRLETENQMVFAAKAESFLIETLRGIQSIKLFNGLTERKSHWLNLEIDRRNADLKIQKVQMISQTFNGLIFGIESIVIIWLGATFVMDGALSVGMLFAVISYKSQFSSRAANLVDQYIALRMIRVQTERLTDIVLTPREETSAKINGQLDLKPTIELRNVSYRYDDQSPWVLDNCSMMINEGESVAITGTSGAGKTTLVKILLGLLTPQSGEVLYGGINIHKLGLDDYRERIATVMQDDNLFAGSVLDNITFFSRTPNQEQAAYAAHLAALHDEIAAMPMAYNTLIGDMGTSLSGGQKQRLLLARALYRKPAVLILDEATSHLDGDNENRVNQAVNALDLTRIFVAHRESTIQMAQRVIVLQQGQIV